MIITCIVFFLFGLVNRLGISGSNYGLFTVSANGNYYAFFTIIVLSFVFFVEAIVLFGRRNSTIVILSYLFRVFLLIWDRYFSYIFNLPGSGGDSEGFHRIAILRAAQASRSNYGGTYTKILSVIYRLFDGNRIIGQYFNILLSMCTILIVYIILKEVIDNKSTRRFGLTLICFAPNYAILSSILIREAPISLIIAYSLYCFIKYWKSDRFLYFFFSVILCLFAATFHSGSIAPAIGYIGAYLLYDKKKEKFSFKPQATIGLVIVVFVFMFLFRRYGSVFFDRFIGKDIESVVENSSSGGRGASTYAVGIKTGNTLFDMIFNTPIRLLYFYMAPMPWDWRGIKDVISFLFSSCFYFYGYFAVFKVLKSSNKIDNYQLIIAVLLALLAGGVVFAWGTSNAGTALRHRDKFISIYIVLATLCIDFLKKIKEVDN